MFVSEMDWKKKGGNTGPLGAEPVVFFKFFAFCFLLLWGFFIYSHCKGNGVVVTIMPYENSSKVLTKTE